MRFVTLLLCLIPCAVASALLERWIFRVEEGFFTLLLKNYVFAFVFYYAVHLLTMDRPMAAWKELLLTVPLTTVVLGLVIRLIAKINERINDV